MKQLGKYELLEELGKGGFGTVYRARETVLELERAVKVLHPNLVNTLEFIERFRREAKVSARLDHPNIVPVYELAEEGGYSFLTMKFMPGGSLKDWLAREGPMPYKRAVEIVTQIAEGLVYAYNQPEKLIHRDIKPANILFDEDGTARICDFGFAKALAHTSSVSTSSISGGMVGTPAYIAPEIWSGKGASPATDIYSLACVFFEMITGNVLFDGESPADIMKLHVLDGPSFPQIWPQDFPPQAEETLRRALANDPGQRYNTALALAGELANPTTGSARKDRKDNSSHFPDRSKPRWRLWLAGVGLVVLALLFFQAPGWNPTPPNTSSPNPTSTLRKPTSTPRPSTSTPRKATSTPRPSPTSSAKYAYISASNAYLYQGPGLDFYPARSDPYSKGSKFTVLARSTQSNWLLCKAQDGTVGWLYKDWIDISFSIFDVSVAATIPVPPLTPTRRPSSGRN